MDSAVDLESRLAQGIHVDDDGEPLTYVDFETMEEVTGRERQVAGDMFWLMNWHQLARFLAIEYPSHIPGGHALSSGYEWKYPNGVVSYSWDPKHWQAQALDFAMCCDLLAAIQANDQHSDIPTQPTIDGDTKAPYRPALWFKDKFAITADALKGQKQRGNLAYIKQAHWNLYSTVDARRIWPQEVSYIPKQSE